MSMCENSGFSCIEHCLRKYKKSDLGILYQRTLLRSLDIFAPLSALRCMIDLLDSVVQEHNDT